MDIEPLELRRLKADLVLYYKMFNNLIALPSNEYFYHSEAVYQTRSGGNRINMPLCHNNCFENDFFNRCIACWNSLSSSTVNAASIRLFKILLASNDLSQYLHCDYF